MPTEKPRINTALRREHYDTISRLAKLQGRSRSAIVAELLEAAIPTLERVCVVIEAAQRAQSTAKAELVSSLQKAEAAIMPHVHAALGQLDMLLPGPGDEALAEGETRPPRTAAAPRNASSGAAGSTRSRRRSPGRGGAVNPRLVTRGSGQGATPGKRSAAKRRKSH